MDWATADWTWELSLFALERTSQISRGKQFRFRLLATPETNKADLAFLVKVECFDDVTHRPHY